jgi:hypothetical protein
MDPVREVELPNAEAGEHLTCVTIELQNWVDQVLGAPASQSARAATIVSPDVSVVRIDIDARC